LPDLIIVDGGKGQLSAACRELQRLGLHDLPIIGLAKEREEIYRPDRALPLQLPIDSGALRLLQRIRDEAHRFANAYHQLLMKKRVGESILDDCPGVSQNRKNLLLRRFGSVNRLRRGRRWRKSLPRKGLAESWPKKCINSCKGIDLSVDLKLTRFPARSPLPIAALPSMSPIPSAPLKLTRFLTRSPLPIAALPFMSS
jgi:Nuclease subunit of the excinuclease complex